VHGSADAGAATPIETQSPITVADATDIEAMRRRGDMSHLSRGHDVALTSESTNVTIVISGAIELNDVRIGIHP
jgi:hypothetical protein